MVETTTPDVEDDAEQQDLSCAQQASAWAREQIADEDEVNIPALASALTTHLLGDMAFLNAYVKATLPGWSYLIARKVVGETRMRPLEIIAVPASRQREMAKPQAVQWLERVETRRHLRLMSFTKEQLIAACEYRMTQGNRHIRIAKIWKKIADKLQPGQRVRDRFTEQEIDRLLSGI